VGSPTARPFSKKGGRCLGKWSQPPEKIHPVFLKIIAFPKSPFPLEEDHSILRITTGKITNYFLPNCPKN